jgi:hypothetical protein
MLDDLVTVSRILGSERRTETGFRRALYAEQHVLPCVQVVDAALEVIHGLAQAMKVENESERESWALAARTYNSAASALRLIASGYPQQALSVVRELLEHAFLIDWFCTAPEQFNRWRTCSQSERIKEFSPRRVRDALRRRDGCEPAWRKEIYGLLSQHAVHPSPQTWQLLAVEGGMIYIGPFFDLAKVQNCLVDLSRASVLAGLSVARFLPSDESAAALKARLVCVIDEWASRYMPGWQARRFPGSGQAGSQQSES